MAELKRITQSVFCPSTSTTHSCGSIPHKTASGDGRQPGGCDTLLQPSPPPNLPQMEDWPKGGWHRKGQGDRAVHERITVNCPDTASLFVLVRPSLSTFLTEITREEQSMLGVHFPQCMSRPMALLSNEEVTLSAALT